MSNNTFYITTSIAYVNAAPHIGFAQELLQADVLARWRRQCGDDVFYLTGTDEHGVKNYQTAQKEGRNVRQFVDENAAAFKKLCTSLNISNDDFIRTTDEERHWPGVEKAWRVWRDNGDIYKKEYEGLYCVGCERFITDKELEDGKCPVHHKAPEPVSEENYFFRLSKYADRVKAALEREEIQVYPKRRANEIIRFIEDGVEDISFSRAQENLPWGVPVPFDEEHISFVWSDALLNYISAIGYGRDEERLHTWWPAQVQGIGKDITRFHLLYWPAILMSLDLPLPERFLIHGFITVDGQKMSKSLGNVIDPFELVEQYGVDATRYFLLREIPPTEDGDFSYDRFKERYNADLASGLGNLLARLASLGAGYEIAPNDNFFDAETARRHYTDAMEEFRFHKALELVWQYIAHLDKTITDREPWRLEGEERLPVLNDCFGGLQLVGELLKPFLPATADSITETIDRGRAGILEKQEPLFPRL